MRVSLGEPPRVALLVAVAGSVAQALAPALGAKAPAQPSDQCRELGRVLSVELPVRVVVARRAMTVRDLLHLAPGRVVDLEVPCGAPLELYAGSKLMARGEAMLVGDRFGFRVGELARPGAATGRPPKLVR